MWALLVISIFVKSPLDTKTTGSIELRFNTKEECMEAKDRFDNLQSFKNNRIKTSCSYRSYL
jgi:hypothetical protein